MIEEKGAPHSLKIIVYIQIQHQKIYIYFLMKTTTTLNRTGFPKVGVGSTFSKIVQKNRS